MGNRGSNPLGSAISPPRQFFHRRLELSLTTVGTTWTTNGNCASFIRDRYDINKEFAVQAFSAGSQDAQSPLRLLG